MNSDDFKAKKAALKAAQADVEKTVDGNREYHAQLTKYQTASLTGSAKESLNSVSDCFLVYLLFESKAKQCGLVDSKHDLDNRFTGTVAE